jgi:hypothetical protein
MTLKKDLLDSINDVIHDVFDSKQDIYPSQAVPKGTYVRSSKWNLLGVVTDGFYSEVDGQRIIIYTVLYIPNTSMGSYYKNLLTGDHHMKSNLFVDNELEFDLVYYLMIPPVNMDEIEIFSSSGDYKL